MNTYYIETIKSNKGYCKKCKILFDKYEDVELIRCNTHFDIINKIEPHIIGLFHYSCLDKFWKENEILPEQIKFYTKIKTIILKK